MRIYYSIQDNGDGSASVMFLETQELATWDQEQMTEGWAEDCSGSLELKSDSQVTSSGVLSVAGYYLEKLKDYDEEYGRSFNKKEFEDKFFPSGVPMFRVLILDGDNSFYHIYVNGLWQYKILGWNRKTEKLEVSGVGCIELRKELNNKRKMYAK